MASELEDLKACGQVLDLDAQGIGYDRRAGDVIWWNKPSGPSLLYSQAAIEALQADRNGLMGTISTQVDAYRVLLDERDALATEVARLRSEFVAMKETAQVLLPGNTEVPELFDKILNPAIPHQRRQNQASDADHD